MHIIGVALTILLGIVGFWDVKGVFDSELFANVAMPLLGLGLLAGFMKIALDRST
jgi:hypothetical protein